MTKKLYPLKFQPILKTKIWGGNRLVKEYSKYHDPEEEIDIMIFPLRDHDIWNTPLQGGYRPRF